MPKIHFKRKYIVLASLLLTVIVVTCNLSLLHYAYMQLKGQLKIIIYSEKVSELQSNFDIYRLEKLHIIEETLAYCREELGMDTKNNYTMYFEHGDSTLMHIVTASKPYALEPYLWSFPIVGSFPYKGFFSKFYADLEAQKLKDKGYDVRVGKVSAWSTLGITSDPILSGMLQKDEGKLVELIIHEITHSNIYYIDSSEYNENLADFIGHYGSLGFLATKYGENAQEIEKHRLQKLDSQTYGKLMNENCTKLNNFYKRLSQKQIDDDIKKVKKESFMKQLIDKIDTSSFNYPKNYAFLKRTRFTPNNAFFTSFLVYRAKQDLFSVQLNDSFEGDLKAFIQFHRKKSH